MSRQYLTAHTIDLADLTDIFCLAVTSNQIIAGTGASSLKVWSTTDAEYPLQQVLPAHSLGCFSVAVSRDGKCLASVGFDGFCIIWSSSDGQWIEQKRFRNKDAGEFWAIALSRNGQFLASTTFDGRTDFWDGTANWKKTHTFETRGSFGMTIDISADGRYTATGHQSGSIYVFNNESGRLVHSLTGLVKVVRAVAISPASRILAAAGDAKIIALYDIASGEQIGILNGHTSWIMSLAWSNTGEFLLSGAYDGKTKVWSMESRNCVATHAETDEAVWAVKWLPKTGNSELFVAAGANKSITFYREAA